MKRQVILVAVSHTAATIWGASVVTNARLPGMPNAYGPTSFTAGFTASSVYAAVASMQQGRGDIPRFRQHPSGFVEGETLANAAEIDFQTRTQITHLPPFRIEADMVHADAVQCSPPFVVAGNMTRPAKESPNWC